MGNIAEARSKLGENERSLIDLEKAIEIWKQLNREDPTDTKFQSGMASCLCKFGSQLRAAGKAGEAITAFQEAIKISEQLIRDNPQVVDFQSALGGTLNNLALLQSDSKNYLGAKDSLLRAIDYQKAAHSTEPNHPQYRQFLQNHYKNLKAVARKLNDKALEMSVHKAQEQLSSSDAQFAPLDVRLSEIEMTATTKDSEEAGILIHRCYVMKKYDLAVRIFSNALARDPGVIGFGYEAASCATLAAKGETGANASSIETERSRLRGLARKWLMLGVDQLTENFELQKRRSSSVASILDKAMQLLRRPESNMEEILPPERIVEILQFMQTDADFQSIRDPDQLSGLSAAERKEWDVFWEAVRNLEATVSKEFPGPPAEQAPSPMPTPKNDPSSAEGSKSEVPAVVKP